MEDWASAYQTFKEWRRMRALDLSQQGWEQREIAVALEVSRGAVSRWLAAARLGGAAALRSRPIVGRSPKLTWEQRRLIPDFLWHGAEAYGFRGEVWTCPRVAKVIKDELGVSYSRSQVSRILKDFAWTPQIPVTLAIQRDEVEIRQWRKEVWPEVKKRARREHRTLLFSDESGFYLLPGIVKTYAPEGLTPVVYEWQTRDHLSVMAAITPDGKTYSLVRQKSLNGLHTVAFLCHLLREVRERLLLVWDNSPIHRRHEVQEFLAGPAAGKIHIEPLPRYAPDLNPVEWMWKHLKKVEMRNLVCLDLEELHTEFHLALGRLRQKPWLIPSFFAGAELEL
jgi:transposase